ncbi:OSCP/delta subunit of ATPase [Blyttiomyces helicus]|uniref:ATP synthase subunit 5, mitochondrial n=1 Tax=Blyttiomyces helicus TaxID=388810 RepID=A0A4P9WBD6_9FUNG|nr:OSCP/delta subunit of ATPase [Blyttiomyces helicus]|eukprot:RKO89929.1 OSCP/delta subunit of ATPase [Blyttiomyces helicus]
MAARSSGILSADSGVPLKLHGIDGRYTTALFTAATKNGSLEAVEADLAKIGALLEKDPQLRSFLETPLVDRAAKKEGIASIKKAAKTSATTQNFLELLAENGRLDQTSKVIKGFTALMAAHRGEVNVSVTSAKDLDAKVSKQLRDILQKSSLIEKNAKLIVTNKVDPQILGGLIIEVGEKTIDLSVSSKITKLNRLLTEAI